MIACVLGKTGSGKSLFCTSEFVIDRLLGDADAYIVAFLPLKMDELNAYFQENYPGRSINCLERVRLLSAREARRFYCHRETGVDLPEPSKADLADEDLVWVQSWANIADKSHWRITYIIDEAHIFFDAREWAKVGAAMNTICSQHRKLRVDDIVFCTQFLKQLELRLREHCAQFYECHNWGMKRFSFFKLPTFFTVSVTSKPPPYPLDYTMRRRFDLKIAKCYDTTAGAGLTGGRPPEVIKRKGISLWWAVPFAVLLGLVLFFGPDRVVAWFLGNTVRKPTPAQRPAVGKGGESVARGGSYSELSALGGLKGGQDVAERHTTLKADGGALARVMEAIPEVYPTGSARRGARIIIQFSDGSRMTAEEFLRAGARVKWVGMTYIEMTDGTRIHFRPLQKTIATVRGDVAEPVRSGPSGSLLGDPPAGSSSTTPPAK